MKYLQVLAFEKISQLLSDLSCDNGSRINGRVEAYSCKAVSAEKALFKQLNHSLDDPSLKDSPTVSSPLHAPVAANDSSIGSLIDDKKTRQLYFYLVGTLNSAYPDCTFGWVGPSSFQPVTFKGNHGMGMQVSGSLMNSVQAQFPTFSQDFWSTLDNFIGVEDEHTSIYRFKPDVDSSIHPRGMLWGFHYLIYNSEKKQVVLLECTAVSKLHDNLSDEEDGESDVDMSLDDEEFLYQGDSRDTGSIMIPNANMEQLLARNPTPIVCTTEFQVTSNAHGELQIQPSPLLQSTQSPFSVSASPLTTPYHPSSKAKLSMSNLVL